jgi:hypothetical protein
LFAADSGGGSISGAAASDRMMSYRYKFAFAAATLALIAVLLMWMSTVARRRRLRLIEHTLQAAVASRQQQINQQQRQC